MRWFVQQPGAAVSYSGLTRRDVWRGVPNDGSDILPDGLVYKQPGWTFVDEMEVVYDASADERKGELSLPWLAGR